MIPEEPRFEIDPDALIADDPGLPAGWDAGSPGSGDVPALTGLLRAHEEAARGWASAGSETVATEVTGSGRRMRAHVVLRDPAGAIRAWGSVHDRAEGRMVYAHTVDPRLDEPVADRVSTVLMQWAVGQARTVGAARGLAVQQVDSGAFAGDARQQAWLAGAGFVKVRTWWQMSRPVTPEDRGLVPDPARWTSDRLLVRLVRRDVDGLPDGADLRAVHGVLESAFADHFNSREESFEEFVHRLREDPGHHWDHWWLAELELAAGLGPVPVAALVGSRLEGADGAPDGSYVDYLGVLDSARGQGAAKALLHTIIADAAARGRDRVGLEVDADSPTGAEALYLSMGWETSYVTESWHRDVPSGLTD